MASNRDVLPDRSTPHGFYTAERPCFVSGCAFSTLSRDEFWEHVLAGHVSPLPADEQEATG